MRRPIVIGTLSLLSVILLALVMLRLQKEGDQKYLHYDHAFDPYLSAFTYGEISRLSPVTVVFASDVAPADQVGKVLDNSPFQFSPNLPGKATWTDTRTLVFTPENKLASGQIFRAALKMGDLVPGIESKLKTFYFQFASRPQRFQVEVASSHTSYVGAKAFNQVTGVVYTSDYEEDKIVEAAFEAQAGHRAIPVRWEHYANNNKHVFILDSIARKDTDFDVTVKWNGEKSQVRSSGEEVVTIPALGKFKVSRVFTSRKPEQVVVIEFSDPVDPGQSLNGLISLGDAPFRTLVEGNQVKLFPLGKVKGSLLVSVESGIQSTQGDRMTTKFGQPVAFEGANPELKMVGKGVIMPQSKMLPFVFEAVGLRSIDVRIIKIFESNIPQFLQVNQLDEQNELRRVGQVVVMKKIELDPGNKFDLTQWNRHALDLSTLITPDPGAIYEVAIAFRRSYTLAACADAEAGDENEAERNLLDLNDDWTEPGYDSFWDYYSYWDEESDEPENPCDLSYYSYDRIIRRNVLASDLGLMAKQGEGGSLFVVTDLKTAGPMANVAVEVFDYQHQLLRKGTTDEKGIVRLAFDRKPFLLVAKSGTQRGYLRLDDGSSLPISEFDVAGQRTPKGLNGTLYGERGVWRPGDDMHLTFVLEDKLKTLPANHPVTFELVDARGSLIQKETKTEGKQGFYTFTGKTEASAPTGNYLARVKVGGATFQKTLKVETIMPNRLKIQLDFGKTFLKVAAGDPTAKLTGTWLHGAPARGLKADVAVDLTATTTRFKGYESYTFDDPTRRYSQEEKVLFDGKLSETGEATFVAKFPTSNGAPGQLNANFRCRVFEPGGNFSTDRFSMPLYPYENYVGVKAPEGDNKGMLLTDMDHSILIATVDANGKPISRSGLKVKLYKLEWRWWWDRSQEDFTDYRGKINAEEIQSGTVNTVNGQGSWKLRINKPEWGRYLIQVTDAGGHATGQVVYVDWPGWAGRSRGGDQEAASMLTISADKEKYAVGQEITLNIPTGFAGRALVTIENGVKVLQANWIDAQSGGVQYKFKATADMAPNVYAYVTLLQPHAQTTNDLPIRMYGVIPVYVEDPASHLSPTITMAETLEPNSNFTVKVGESKGGPMTYTLAIVDEGLLDITRFKTPDLWDVFYRKQALEVKTWDLYDQVLGAYGGELKSILSIGGSEEGELGPGPKNNRFKPVVIFAGPFELKAGEVKSHSFDMPNYVGSVKVMVVAGNGTSGYGKADKTVPVRKPLMVLATLPRVLGPGESVRLPVSVFAMDPSIQNVEIRVKAQNGIIVEGSETQTLKFSAIGDKLTNFNLSVLKMGTGTVTVTATSGAYSATYSTDIEVRNPNPRVSKAYVKVLDAGGNWSEDIAPPGASGTNHGVIEVSSIPPLNLSKRLTYLIRYPYGCVEQITSGAFPQLFVGNVMEVDEDYKKRMETNVKAAIEKLKAFQTSGGGLSYWPGKSDQNEWGTNYAGHFLIEAEKAGYALPSGFMTNWRKFQSQKARDWAKGERSDQMTQAYRLYLLALEGHPEMGAMNKMRQQSGLYGTARYLLAAAYQLGGQSSTASQLIEQVTTQVPDYREWSGTFGSGFRDQSMILLALTTMNNKEASFNLVKTLSERLSSERWYSTQETSVALVAISNYLKQNQIKGEMSFEYRYGQGAWQKVKQTSPVFQADLGAIAGGKVEIRNTSKGQIYARMITDGIPAQGDTTAVSSGLKLAIRYTDLKGVPISVKKIGQGMDFLAEVTVTSTNMTSTIQNLALTQIFPSGWEITNRRLDNFSEGGDEPTYQDIRDDRVNTFFDLAPGKSKKFTVLLNASYLGRYYLPTVSVEAMYDQAINARRGGGWVDVVESGNGG